MISSLKKIFGRNDKQMPDVKPGRNDPCWCGSGKKYKRCHLEADERKRSSSLASKACRTST